MAYAHWNMEERRWEMREGAAPAEVTDFSELPGNPGNETHGQEIVALFFVKNGLVDAGVLVGEIEAALPGVALQNDVGVAALHGYVNTHTPLDEFGIPLGRTLVEVHFYQFTCNHDGDCGPSRGPNRPPPFVSRAVPTGARRGTLLNAIRNHVA